MTAALVAGLRAELDEGGLRGSFLVRDLRTGREIGIDPDRAHPVASLIKVPLAAVTLERIRRGELDGATPITVPPGRISTPGPTGITRFRHPAQIAVDDLLYLALAISDNAAADALFSLTPPETPSSPGPSDAPTCPAATTPRCSAPCASGCCRWPTTRSSCRATDPPRPSAGSARATRSCWS